MVTAFLVASFVPMLLLLGATVALRIPGYLWGPLGSSFVAVILLVAALFVGYLEVSGQVVGWPLIPLSFALVAFTCLGAFIGVVAFSEIQERRREERYLRRKEVERRVSRLLAKKRGGLMPLTEEEVRRGIDWNELQGWLSRH